MRGNNGTAVPACGGWRHLLYAPPVAPSTIDGVFPPLDGGPLTGLLQAMRRHAQVLRFLVLVLLAGTQHAGAHGGAPDPAAREGGRLLVLHTNDLHDHVRAGAAGIGGMPYVSGYVRSVRAQREDVLVLDAGDAAEKGDLVAFLTGSEITFEAMARVGYDAIAIGNHEHNFGLDQVRRFDVLSGERMLALNLVGADGQPLFPPSRLFEVGGLRVAVIGIALPRPYDTLDFEASGAALAAHAAMLRRTAGAELVIALCHVGVEQASLWSRQAPDVDVFVTGHTHEALLEPVVVPETGALLVQAGSNARWIGRLELEVVDGRVTAYRGELVELAHDRVAPDASLQAWVAAREAALYPTVDDVLTTIDAPLGWFAIARLAADAVRSRGAADVGLYHPTHVVRNALLPGPVTANALFRLAAERGHALVAVELTGAEIDAYLNGLARRDYAEWGLTQWAGFAVRAQAASDGAPQFASDLEPGRRYRVIMPATEWEKRFLRLAAQLEGDEREGPLAARSFVAEPAGFSSLDAKIEYLTSMHGVESIEQRLQALGVAQGDSDPWESTVEAQVLAHFIDAPAAHR
jgi:2',3'-cyclic-nucleotide 2'-phosphodiesterase (5'-nucleotidase family)